MINNKKRETFCLIIIAGNKLLNAAPKAQEVRQLIVRFSVDKKALIKFRASILF